MAYVLKECFANPNNYGGQRKLSDIKFIKQAKNTRDFSYGMNWRE